jgi:alpha-mannosidase
MSDFNFSALMAELNAAASVQNAALDRLRAELDFAARMAHAEPQHAAQWEPLIAQAAAHVTHSLRAGKAPEAAVAEAEEILAPLGPAAKEYVIICCGHAHIDMNWMWSWPETVSVTYDTFSTMDKLMEEFRTFCFSQSQASVYHLIHKYAPEMFDRIRRRVQEGRWEVTASQWVEGDKNMANGEILCRHLLYTRRWVAEHLGLPYDSIKIDWECDTFGHCWTLPGILTRGGVSRYYHHRASGPQLRGMTSGEMSQLYWWEGKDGSRVLAFDDSPNGYNNEISPRMTHLLFALQKHTGLKCMLWVYGVGDHGGGPTRRHLRAAQEMATWPIFPQVKLGTTDDFFSAVEKQIAEQNLALPVLRQELNFVFEGCYTSQSRIKFANRKGENDLVDTEVVALLGKTLAGLPYPADTLRECWRRAMFLQFHDILPGSGVKETVEHAMGLFQENLANTNVIRTRALRAVAAKVDTSALPAKAGADLGLGAGAGNGAWWGGVSSLSAGAAGCDPFVVFNPAPFERTELVLLKVWNRDLPNAVCVCDASGNAVSGQIIERGDYWGHKYAVVAFLAERLPAMGYRAYVVQAGEAPAPAEPAYALETGRPLYRLGYVHAQVTNPVIVGNEFLEMTISAREGGIISLVDKPSGVELCNGELPLGALLRQQEAPHAMTAWQLGAIVDEVEPLRNSTLHVLADGPNVAAVRLVAKHNDSEYRLTISLPLASRQVLFELDVNWLERGDPATGVPTLRACFPLNVYDGKATHEIACGSIERPADGEEAPALNWVDLTGTCWETDATVAGATLLNDSKYGHRVSDEAIELTLLRSSYDPDPLPELGRHTIRYALVPHVGALDVGDATRAGYAFNHPLVPVNTDPSPGDLPTELSLVEVLTPNVMFSGLKQAEDGDGMILRLYEMAGRRTTAQVRLSERLVPAAAAAVETDILERPLAQSSARLQGGILSVDIPPFAVATVRIG